MSVGLQQKFVVEAVSGGCKLDPKFAVQSSRPLVDVVSLHCSAPHLKMAAPTRAN